MRLINLKTCSLAFRKFRDKSVKVRLGSGVVKPMSKNTNADKLNLAADDDGDGEGDAGDDDDGDGDDDDDDDDDDDNTDEADKPANLLISVPKVS